MDRETAAKIRDVVQEGADRIRSSVDGMRGQLSGEDFKKYCKVVGAILGDVQLELLRPYVYSQFPDLAPKTPDGPDSDFIQSLEPKFKQAAERTREAIGGDRSDRETS